MEVCDYLIVGGGSGGCAVAGRLSEDADSRVTVLEAGGNGNSWIVNTPAAVIGMLPTRINNWAFETVPQAGLNGRCGYQPRGKMLGGSSGLNAMVYIRGHRWDYDHWAALGMKAGHLTRYCLTLSVPKIISVWAALTTGSPARCMSAIWSVITRSSSILCRQRRKPVSR